MFRHLFCNMTSARSSRTTSRFFPISSNGSSLPQQRRVTRSSIVQVDNSPTVNRDTGDNNGEDSDAGDFTFGSDIEDAMTRTRKRRKITTTTSTTVFKTEEESTTTTTSKPATPRRRARKPARKTTDHATGNTGVLPPSDWQEMYDAVLAMRREEGGVAANAAVDTMGCERLADRSASPRDQRFHTLVALMLSSQTKDTVNAVVMRRLQTELPAYKEGAPKGLNLENILAVDADKLNELIWAVGFHNNKTKYIKQAAIILRDKFNGDIPDTIESLTSLPGVGPKMAYLCLSAAWDRTEGIGVDVHVHRITNLWGWHATKTPEETRFALQSWLPRDRWREINWLLVGFGQTVCLPVGRRCGECELGLRGLCRAAERGKVARGRREMVKAKIEVGGGVEEVENGEGKGKVKVEVELEEEVGQVKSEPVNEDGGDDKINAESLGLPTSGAKRPRGRKR